MHRSTFRISHAAFVLLAATVTLAAQTPAESAGVPREAPSEADPPLETLLERYFSGDDARRREVLAKAIDEAARGNIAAVAAALPRLKLWTPSPVREGQLESENAPARTGSKFVPADIAQASGAGYYRLPDAYDVAQRWPMLLCLPGEGIPAKRAVGAAEEMLGEASLGMVRIAPGRPMPATFHQSPETAGELQAILLAARRRFCLDSDRVYLFGLGDSGDAAWLVAINQPRPFAGVIIMAGQPRVPYPQQALPFLLGNLRHLPVLTVWSEDQSEKASARAVEVAATNRAIVEFATEAGLPIRGAPRSVPTDVTLAVEAAQAIKPPPEEVEQILNHRRSPPPQPVDHWFRYPSHGDLGWVRQSAFEGDVWTADQLSILVRPDADRDQFIRSTIQDLLAYVGAEVDGQRIELTTRRCRGILLTLPCEGFDFTQPVTVYCNGKKRIDGPVRPSIPTMLETASETWEFQHPVAATLGFSIHADAAPTDEQKQVE